MSDSWHSYSSIYALGHAALTDLLKGPVYVEEKIDGSQFSFCLTYTGDLRVRSKGCEMVLDAPEKMFIKAVDTVKRLGNNLHSGWTYRCEYLAKPKHNVLAYDRVPAGNLIVFDIEIGECQFLSYADKVTEAKRLGLETVPLLYKGLITGGAFVRSFLLHDSCLGGRKIEGVVIKPIHYDLFGRDKKVLMGKFVSEEFKEIHAKEWKVGNPTTKDIIDMLAVKYTTPARWNKAIQHLTERGLITNTSKDIGEIMREVPEDIKKECEEEIKANLFAYAWPHLSRMVTRGLPEFYKDRLFKQQAEMEWEKTDAETHIGEATGC